MPSSTGSNGKCTSTSKMDLGAGIVVGAVPDVAWTQNGAVWHLDSVGNYQSSNTAGAA